jgi:hypothetical protein
MTLIIKQNNMIWTLHAQYKALQLGDMEDYTHNRSHMDITLTRLQGIDIMRTLQANTAM